MTLLIYRTVDVRGNAGYDKGSKILSFNTGSNFKRFLTLFNTTLGPRTGCVPFPLPLSPLTLLNASFEVSKRSGHKGGGKTVQTQDVFEFLACQRQESEVSLS